MSHGFPGQVTPAIWTFLEWLGSGVRHAHLAAQNMRVAQGHEWPDPLTAFGNGYESHRTLVDYLRPLADAHLLADDGTTVHLVQDLHSQCKCMGV